MKLLDYLKNATCFIVVPICFFILLVLSNKYGNYPYMRGVFVFLLFLVVLSPSFFIFNKEKLWKFGLYVVLISAAFILSPSYFAITPGFIGNRLARFWYEENFDRSLAERHWKSDFILKDVRFEKLTENEAVFFYPDPPVSILISLGRDNPRCVGFPDEAEAKCNLRIKELVEGKKGGG